MLGFHPGELGNGKWLADISISINTGRPKEGRRLKRSFILPPSSMHLQISDFSSNLSYPSLITHTSHDEKAGQTPRILCTCLFLAFEVKPRLKWEWVHVSRLSLSLSLVQQDLT